MSLLNRASAVLSIRCTGLVGVDLATLARFNRDMTTKRCSWCRNPDADVDDGTLCLDHQAENEGLTVDEVMRRDAIQTAEWLDTGDCTPAPPWNLD
jgi:hypothetical protein